MPAVSIITPLYNGRTSIESCIRSVQNQTYTDYEHLVIDNISTDDGPTIVALLAKEDPRIKLLSNDTTQGAGPTRNLGITKAKGRYIAFLDADDLWRPEKLERHLHEMNIRRLAFSWTSYMVRNATQDPVRIQRADITSSYDDLLHKKTVIGCLTTIYDQERLGKHFMNNLGLRQDFCLWLDIMKTCDARGFDYGGIDVCLADYAAGGMSSNKKKAALMQWRAYREHVGLSRSKSASLMVEYVLRALRDRIFLKADGRPENADSRVARS